MANQGIKRMNIILNRAKKAQINNRRPGLTIASPANRKRKEIQQQQRNVSEESNIGQIPVLSDRSPFDG